ncbi:MAG: GspMb/PilO family protein [Akkermansiaceae bacterium]
MSSREKNLLILLLSALFLVFNFFAFKSLYQGKKATLSAQQLAAENKLTQAEAVMESGDNWERAGSWLERSEGKPIAAQSAGATLQAFVEREAKKRGLIVRSQDVLPWEEGSSYQRVRVKYKVSGREQQIQQWLMTLRQNRQLQVITKFSMKPVNNDLTQVDCEVEVEKFILPLGDEDPAL